MPDMEELKTQLSNQDDNPELENKRRRLLKKLGELDESGVMKRPPFFKIYTPKEPIRGNNFTRDWFQTWPTPVSKINMVKADERLSYRGKYKKNMSTGGIRTTYFDVPLDNLIYVRHLSEKYNYKKLKTMFSRYGNVWHVFVSHSSARRHDGFAFITMRDCSQANLAVQNISSKPCDGIFLNLIVSIFNCKFIRYNQLLI